MHVGFTELTARYQIRTSNATFETAKSGYTNAKRESYDAPLSLTSSRR